jgi:hypothetical protein
MMEKALLQPIRRTDLNTEIQKALVFRLAVRTATLFMRDRQAQTHSAQSDHTDPCRPLVDFRL